MDESLPPSVPPCAFLEDLVQVSLVRSQTHVKNELLNALKEEQEKTVVKKVRREAERGCDTELI
jgi:hypothetical protein